MCVYFYIISVLVLLILVHQVKLDLNEKCCQGDLLKLINIMLFLFFILLINDFFVRFFVAAGIFLVKSVSIVILKLYNDNNN